MTLANLFSDLEFPLPEERLQDVLTRPGIRIERILSTGQASPPDFWYDQDWDEWVLLLTGAATLDIADERRSRRLLPGDHVFLPARCRHRVAWTDPDQPTVWLAVHIGEKRSG